MITPRYLCSHLICLTIPEPRALKQWATLEEIWSDGAMLECESEVFPGESVTISTDEVSFSGSIAAVNAHQFGWQAEITFLPSTLWTIEQWHPDHALDLNSLRRKLQ